MFGFLVTMMGALFIVLVATKTNTMLTVIISLVLIGLGMGFTIGTPLNYMMLENTKPEQSNSALATLSLVRSIGTAIAPAIMVGFLAHAGLTVGDKIMNILPQPSSPAIIQVDELNTMLTAMKSDPNTADMLKDVQLPDFNSSGNTEINMNSGSLPDDLLNSMQSADVTNITDKVKDVSVYMFDKNTPGVIADIETGVKTGIVNMQKGIDGITEGEDGVKSGIAALDTALAKMKQGKAGLETGITQMQTALTAQDAAISQMNAASGSNATSIMPLNISASNPSQSSEETEAEQTSAGNQAITGAAEAMQAQAESLVTARAELSQKLESTKAQLKELESNISALEVKKRGMKDSLSKMGEQKAALIEAQNKTKEIQAEVPKAFEKSKSEYIAKINSMSRQIQDTFQAALNVGFRQMFFTVFIANLIGFILLLFYKERKNQEI